MAEGPMTPPQHRHVPVAPGAPERPPRPENVNNKLHNLNLNNGGVARRLFGNQNNN